MLFHFVCMFYWCDERLSGCDIHIVCVSGRLYDSHVLDMMELGIDKFTSIKQFQVRPSQQSGPSTLWNITRLETLNY